MSITNKQPRPQRKKTKPTYASEGRKVRISIIRVVAIACLAIGGIVALFFLLTGLNASREGARFEDYLEDKYGQKFVVENVHIEGSTVGSEGSWVAGAHPKSDSSLKFRVERLRATDEVSVDTFLQVLWTEQGSNEVEAFLARELPANEGYVLNVEPGRQLYGAVHGETPSLKSVLDNHRNLVTYSLSVRNVASIESDEPSATQLENALKVVNFVKQKDISPASYVYYNYRAASFNDRDTTGRQRYQYGIHVEREDLASVDDATDLRGYFKVLAQ